jgi:o-succinylbenzoate synthase
MPRRTQLATLVRTPICLDESIVSLESTADAIALRTTSYLNIKPGRVGGCLEAKRIRDLCLAEGVGVWCGGMLETGIGRAANAALAALPGFTLPGDIFASGRFYARDITPPIELVGGFIEVPTGVGFGVEPMAEVLGEVTTAVEWVGA